MQHTASDLEYFKRFSSVGLGSAISPSNPILTEYGAYVFSTEADFMPVFIYGRNKATTAKDRDDLLEAYCFYQLLSCARLRHENKKKVRRYL